MIEINPGSEIWYNPMHIVRLNKAHSLFEDKDYVKVTLVDGSSVVCFDSLEIVRRRVNAGLRS